MNAGTYLEGVVIPVAVKSQLGVYPVPRAAVFVVETHEPDGIDSVYDGIPDSTRIGEV